MTTTRPSTAPVTVFGPDFPFAFDDWLKHPQGLATLPASAHGTEVAIVGAGIAGLVAAYELMKLGLKPVVYEASRMGGRLRSQPFEGGQGVIAELGGMRFPASSTAFYHYVHLLGLPTQPFPNPLTAAAGSTVVDLEGQTHYARSLADLPPLFNEVAEAWSAALTELGFGDLQQALRERDVPRLKALWDRLVPLWDDRTFYDFIAQSEAFSKLSFRHREVFGQVGFGTGGWDSDFPNTMLEILRVVLTGCDEDQHLISGGVQQVPLGLWAHAPEHITHWPQGTSLASLHGGATRPGVTAIARTPSGQIAVTDTWGTAREYPAVLVTCQSWLLTTQIAVEESLFSQKLWMALDRTRYMQSSKTFVMVDRPFWKDLDPATGRETMSMTLTDRLTRGTYLFDNGPDKPAVICLSYAWMSDALKMLPHPPHKRVQLALDALKKIYPTVDIASHIVGDPITISWEADPYFLGAFKGALPGHYRYNQRMYGHFMQENLPPAERGIFLAGDDVSFTPAWVEGAVQTSLNAVWGIVHQLGGKCPADNPGPGELFPAIGPVVCLSENAPTLHGCAGRCPPRGRVLPWGGPAVKPCLRTMQENLTLALWQTPYAGSTADALQRLDATAAQARAQGADLLITPEMALTGYAIGPERVAALAQPCDGPLAKAVADIAQRHGIAIVYGYPEHNPAAKPFNAAQAIAPDGSRLTNYRKTHLFGDLDRAQFSAGATASQVFNWRGWCLGLLICYDVEFPEAVRGLALQGVDAVLVPTANMAGFDEVQNLLVPARACENRVFVAYANACGSEGHTHYGGLSSVAGPHGAALARADRGPGLWLATLDHAALQPARQNSYLNDRRTDLYGPVVD